MRQSFCFLACLACIVFCSNGNTFRNWRPIPGHQRRRNRRISRFDIRQISFLQLDATLIQAEIDLNYDGGDLDLGQFQVGGDLMNPGDLLFKVGSEYKYGVALQTHSNSPNAASAYNSGGFNILAGAFYQINVGGVLSAHEVLGNSCLDCYRPDEKVWLWNSGNGSVTRLQDAVLDPVTVVRANPGIPNDPELLIRIAFVPDSAFMQALMNNNLSVHFAAATCANDIIDARIASVPEPAPG